MSQRARRMLFLVTAVVLVTLGHYLTSLHLHQAHDLYRRLYYLPVICAGLWFGLRGGLLVSIAIGIVFWPHVLYQWNETPLQRAEQYLEMVLYLVVGVVTGALTQKEAQRSAELREANSKLEEANRQLREQSLSLFHAGQQLHRADRLAALGELSAGMAHEIKNPLGSIKGTAEIFRDSFEATHKLHEFAAILVKETGRLDDILNRFLELARPPPSAHGRCEVGDAVGDVVRLSLARARQARVEIVTELREALPATAIAPDALRQVLLNLMLNGIQAMSDGGRLTIGAAAGPPERLTRVEPPGLTRVVRLSVADTGPGVPPELRGRILDPFFTTKRGGTGLGLAICERIVLAHRGVIYLDTAATSGARFCVELPLAAEEGASAP